MWNSLPNELRRVEDFGEFRRLVRTWGCSSCKCHMCKSVEVPSLFFSFFLVQLCYCPSFAFYFFLFCLFIFSLHVQLLFSTFVLTFCPTWQILIAIILFYISSFSGIPEVNSPLFTCVLLCPPFVFVLRHSVLPNDGMGAFSPFGARGYPDPCTSV